MTVNINDTVDRYPISGVGPYAFSYRIFDETDLAVTAILADIPTLLSLSLDYTVTGENVEAGGSITLQAATAVLYAGYTLDIRSDIAQTQPTRIRNQGAFLPAIHEDALDRLSRQIQDLGRKSNASLRLPDNELTDAVAPSVASRKGRYLFADAITGAFTWVTNIAASAFTQSIFNQYLTDALQFLYSILNPRSPAEIAASVTPVNYAYLAPNILRYGTNATPNTTDMTAAVQAAINANGLCYFPAGTYRIATSVTLTDGCMVYGDSKGFSTITSPAGVHTFMWAPAGATDRNGPSLHDLTINSDYPISINNLTATLGDGSGDSPCMRSHFYNLNCTAVTANSGYGFNAAKMFDSEIDKCYFANYSVGILLHGCDLNDVHTNRIIQFSTYGILEQSAQTFCSQNRIHHNDILAPTGTTATYFKSTAIHVNFCDNYMEKPSGTCTGFVDITSIGAPTYGSNVITLPFSIVIRDNRCDGEGFAGFVYRINPVNAVSIVCENRDTTGGNGTSSFSTPVFPVYSSGSGHYKSVKISGKSWGVWHQFRSQGPYTGSHKGLVCTGENISAIIDKDSGSTVQVLGRAIVLPIAFTGNAWVVPNALSTVNDLFFDSVQYSLTVIARSTAAAGDTLNIAMGSNAHGTTPLACALTDQYKRFSYAFTGRARAGFDSMGALFTRTGAVGDIHIADVSFEMLENTMVSLPSSAPAGGSKQMYYDGADSNRVKFVP